MSHATVPLSMPKHIPSICRNNPSIPARSRSTVASVGDGPDFFEAAKQTVEKQIPGFSIFKVDRFVKRGMVVGLGSGRASSFAVRYLGRCLQQGALRDVVGIPSSVFSASEAAEAGIPLNQYQENLQIDFAFSDADLIEERTLTALIGRRKPEGGESLFIEKSIAKAASKLALIVAEKQYTRDVDGSIPVVIG